MTLSKMVDGVEVLCSPEEEAAIEAEWAQNAHIHVRQNLEWAVQVHLDSRARERGYDGILSASTYAISKDAIFAAEGAGYRDFRDAAWRYCYQQLAAVQAGTRAVPTEAELLAEIDANCPLVLP